MTKWTTEDKIKVGIFLAVVFALMIYFLVIVYNHQYDIARSRNEDCVKNGYEGYSPISESCYRTLYACTDFERQTHKSCSIEKVVTE